jgi:hypothetical protein
VADDERKAWTDLWIAVFGEPPPVAPDPKLAAPILIEHLPPAPPYEVRPVRPDAAIRTDEQAAKP